mmetsp:Transcript_19614/g.56446  ORF Transcript_19614/g.56446 Transcript_19614/m.56446 type:complete len:154 (-) Transcript_19614:269-730(-)
MNIEERKRQSKICEIYISSQVVAYAAAGAEVVGMMLGHKVTSDIYLFKEEVRSPVDVDERWEKIKETRAALRSCVGVEQGWHYICAEEHAYNCSIHSLLVENNCLVTRNDGGCSSTRRRRGTTTPVAFDEAFAAMHPSINMHTTTTKHSKPFK